MNPADYQYYYGKPMAVEPNIVIELLEKGFLPAIVILCSFWFIKYQQDQCKREREQLIAKDTQQDERLIHLVESTTHMIDEMKNAIQNNTQTMKELLTEMRMMERK
tara:strand:- start:221 stop:538 length:318 start_codon:yes stop_codon:yes gene_type:complete